MRDSDIHQDYFLAHMAAEKRVQFRLCAFPAGYDWFYFYGNDFWNTAVQQGLWACMSFFYESFHIGRLNAVVAVELMAAGFAPILALLMTLMVNARHIFYGISMLERFEKFGKSRVYMIFALIDETFSLLCAAKPPEGDVVK